MPVRRRCDILLVALVAALSWPAIGLGIIDSPAGVDQTRNHLLVIQQLAATFPILDLHDYPAAVAPGYHIFMAAVVAATHVSVSTLQLISSGFGMAAVLVVFRVAARSLPDSDALLVTLPFALSAYVIAGSVWLTTDNAGWLGVLGTLAVLTRSAPPGRNDLLLAGLLAACTVFVRQVHVWLVLPLAIAAFVRARRVGTAQAWAEAAVSVLLPMASAAVLWNLWHGTTTPSFANQYRAPWKVAAFVSIGASAGLWGVLFLPAAGLGDRRGRRFCMIAAVAVGALTMWVPTAFDRAAGRWGGPIWSLVAQGPTIAGRSLVMIGLCAMGAVVLCRLVQRANAAHRRPEAGLLLASLAGLAAAQSFSRLEFERYFDPLVLAVLAWLVASGGAIGKRPLARQAIALLAVGQLVLTMGSIYWRPASLTPRELNPKPRVGRAESAASAAAVLAATDGRHRPGFQGR